MCPQSAYTCTHVHGYQGNATLTLTYMLSTVMFHMIVFIQVCVLSRRTHIRIYTGIKGGNSLFILYAINCNVPYGVFIQACVLSRRTHVRM